MGRKANPNKKVVFILLGMIVAFVLGLFVGAMITVSKHPSDLVCSDGAEPDSNGCCFGEIYTDMGDYGYNCCPIDGGDCFPPMNVSDK